MYIGEKVVVHATAATSVQHTFHVANGPIPSRPISQASAAFIPSGVEQELEKEEEKDSDVVRGNEERPGVDRFFTARPGELMSKESTTKTEDKAERLGVERFETAREDLSTIAKGMKA